MPSSKAADDALRLGESSAVQGFAPPPFQSLFSLSLLQENPQFCVMQQGRLIVFLRLLFACFAGCSAAAYAYSIISRMLLHAGP